MKKTKNRIPEKTRKAKKSLKKKKNHWKFSEEQKLAHSRTQRKQMRTFDWKTSTDWENCESNMKCETQRRWEGGEGGGEELFGNSRKLGVQWRVSNEGYKRGAHNGGETAESPLFKAWGRMEDEFCYVRVRIIIMISLSHTRISLSFSLSHSYLSLS